MKKPNVGNKEMLMDIKLRLEQTKLDSAKEQAKKDKAEYRKKFNSVQKDVDEYLALYLQFKELERELKSLRGDIEPFMIENNLSVMQGKTQKGRIERVPTERPNITSRYTTYSTEVLTILEKAIADRVSVMVVDKDALELEAKDDKRIKEDIKSYKMTSSGTNFSIKYN